MAERYYDFGFPKSLDRVDSLDSSSLDYEQLNPDLPFDPRLRRGNKKAVPLTQMALDLPGMSDISEQAGKHLKPDGKKRRKTKKPTPFKEVMDFERAKQAHDDEIGAQIRTEDVNGRVTLIEVGRQGDLISTSGDGVEARREYVTQPPEAPRLSDLSEPARKLLFGRRSGKKPKRKTKTPYRNPGYKHAAFPTTVEIKKRPRNIKKLLQALGEALGK